eukprot:265683-Heterocapsa_arctica.AAC.1
MPVPPGGLPAEPTQRKNIKMYEAVRNGPVQQSPLAEFRRNIKDCLQWREQWRFKLTPDQKIERAGNGSSYFYPGRHFPNWRFGVAGIYDPGKDGYIQKRVEEQGWTTIDLTGTSLYSKYLMVGITCDDIERNPGFKWEMVRQANSMTNS